MTLNRSNESSPAVPSEKPAAPLAKAPGVKVPDFSEQVEKEVVPAASEQAAESKPVVRQKSAIGPAKSVADLKREEEGESKPISDAVREKRARIQPW